MLLIVQKTSNNRIIELHLPDDRHPNQLHRATLFGPGPARRCVEETKSCRRKLLHKSTGQNWISAHKVTTKVSSMLKSSYRNFHWWQATWAGRCPCQTRPVWRRPLRVATRRWDRPFGYRCTGRRLEFRIANCAALKVVTRCERRWLV